MGPNTNFRPVSHLQIWSWKDCTSRNCRILFSFKTVLAMYDQETFRNKGQPSYSRLKTAVRLHIDQAMRAWSCRARNEIVARGMVTNSQKEKTYVERKVGECFQWKATGQCSKGNSVVQSWSSIWKQMRGSKPEKTAFLSRTWYVGKDWQWKKVSGKRQASSSDVRCRILCRYGYCKNPSCNCWHRPVCRNYKSEAGCVLGKICYFRHVEAEENPNKESKNGGANGTVALFKESIQFRCVSQDPRPGKSILWEEGTLRSNHAVKLSKGTWHQKKIWERKGPSRGHIHDCEPHERSPCTPKFEKRS